MNCDMCEKVAVYFLCTPRPSDHSEIVATMATCAEHVRHIGEPVTLEYLLTMWQGDSLVVATVEQMEEYIESPRARKNGHIWLTL